VRAVGVVNALLVTVGTPKVPVALRVVLIVTRSVPAPPSTAIGGVAANRSTFNSTWIESLPPLPLTTRSRASTRSLSRMELFPAPASMRIDSVVPYVSVPLNERMSWVAVSVYPGSPAAVRSL